MRSGSALTPATGVLMGQAGQDTDVHTGTAVRGHGEQTPSTSQGEEPRKEPASTSTRVLRPPGRCGRVFAGRPAHAGRPMRRAAPARHSLRPGPCPVSGPHGAQPSSAGVWPARVPSPQTFPHVCWEGRVALFPIHCRPTFLKLHEGNYWQTE